MATIREFTVLAALALAGAAFAQAPASEQTPQPAGPGENPTQSSPGTPPAGQREITPPPGAEAPAETSTSSNPSLNPNPNPSAESTTHQHEHLAEANGVASGMAVQTESGHPLGFVVDILPGASGSQEDGYVVIAGSAGEGTTPVPYATASSMVRDGKLVINRRRFEHAPKVQQSQIDDPSAWKEKTDSYWSGAGHMAPGEHMGPHMGAEPMQPGRPMPPGPPQTQPQQNPQADLPR